MKKRYKIQLPKGNNAIVSNAVSESGCLYVEVELVKEQKYDPQDGDIISFGYDAIGIVKVCYRGNHSQYVTLSNDRLKFNEGSWSTDNMRPATEEERQKLFDAMAKAGKRWNPGTKKVEDVRWRAEHGKTYFYLTCGETNFLVTSNKDIGLSMDDDRYKCGNYFKTREAAEKVADQISQIFKNSKAE